MNDKINQLLVQSGLLINVSEHRVNELDPNIKKFAELIVQECTAALFDESERLSGLYSDENNWYSAEEYEIRSNQCIDDIALIEKHFGVEE
jgi:hypothetical protein